MISASVCGVMGNRMGREGSDRTAARSSEVALVRDPDHLIPQDECEGHLGCRRQQRDDALSLHAGNRSQNQNPWVMRAAGLIASACAPGVL